MATENITSISIKDVRKLIEDKGIGDSVLDAVDKLLGLLLVFSPVAGGLAAVPLLGLVEPKNELIGILKDAVRRLSKSPAEDYLDQSSRMAAANCMLTYTAFFEAFRQIWPRITERFQIADADAEVFLTQAMQPAVPPGKEGMDSLEFPLPYPVDPGHLDYRARLAAWETMAGRLARLADQFPPMRGQEDVVGQLMAEILSRAERLYQADYLGLAVDFHQFFTWTVLRNQASTDGSFETVLGDIQALADDQRTWFELIARAMHAHDLGLQSLAAAIAQLPRPVTAGTARFDVQPIAEALHRAYKANVRKEIIDDQFVVDDGGQQLQFPRKVDAFVPQAYRALTYVTSSNGEDMHLERDDAWSRCEVSDDVGAFIMRHLESPYSVRAPLLVLGHPGSGKSILTEMLAGHLAYPSYTAIRIKLRDINPDKSLLTLLEDQVRADTGGRGVNWADFASGLAMNPPVIILDGYDELLQATGRVFASYLDEVRQFQDGQVVQRRPVRVIVTSRLTLIDKAIIPHGTTVVRLEDFNRERCTAWSEVWNRHNVSYFEHMGTQPFVLPASKKLLDLARQPLLLLMLAIYDSVGNDLSSRMDIDQTVLYDRLLRRFIERELTKPDRGREFREMSEAERAGAVDREIERLGVAAIGMFNRQDVKINGDQLNDDLKYFSVEKAAPEAGRVLSQAELLLGSFFFVHESRSSLTAGNSGRGAGPTAFEFLHNTFGEFLAADFILRHAIFEAETLRALSANKRLSEQRARHLAELTEAWFGRLIGTPLHTRPVILSMLREWSRHLISGADRPSLLAALDEIVATQLRVILDDLTLPDPEPKQRALSQYTRLSNRGHLATYSLNLVLLRAYVGDEEYVLDEGDLTDSAALCRPWDSLANLWRSWFPLESLSVLAAWMTASRQDTQIVVQPTWSGWVPLGDPRLYLAHSVGVSLADDLTAALTGLHIAFLEGVTAAQFALIRERVRSETVRCGRCEHPHA
jgi:hypothetical protein